MFRYVTCTPELAMSNATRFVWFERMNHNNEAALGFYSRVVGWTVQKWEGEFDCTMFVGPAGPIGGCADLGNDPAGAHAPAGWMAYLGVPDADAAAARVQELGGRVIGGPVDIPGVGRMYVVANPQGAVFSLHQGESGGGEGPSPSGPGAIVWTELVTTDQQAAWPFYASLTGWDTLAAMDMGPGGTYRMFGNGESRVGGMLNGARADGQGTAQPPRWRLYAGVSDIAAAVNQARELGATIVSGPFPVPGGDLVAVLVDPSGIEFGLHQAVGRGG
jgi:predicted enzyme related to lactoylglutathione lyase